MTQYDISTIRARLQRIQNKKVQDMREESELDDSALAMMETGQKAGEHKVVSQVLKILPEQESDVVVDYWALERVRRMGINIMSGDFAYRHSEARRDAEDVVQERVELTQVEDSSENKAYELKDPISKMSMRVSVPTGREDAILNQYMDSFVQKVLMRDFE